MRTRFTVGRSSLTAGGLDADGYTRAATYGDVEPIAVYGWQPLASEMPVSSEVSQRVVTSKLLLVPDVSPFKPGDKVWLTGTVDDPATFAPTDIKDVFYVDEDVRDYNTGPFGYRPGGAVVLKRTKG